MTATLPSPDSGSAPPASLDADVSALELAPPDIERWRDGGSGVPFVHVLDAGRPGPTAMVLALTHGNELCGAIALDWLLTQGVKPRRGRLVLAFGRCAVVAAGGEGRREHDKGNSAMEFHGVSFNARRAGLRPRRALHRQVRRSCRSAQWARAAGPGVGEWYS